MKNSSVRMVALATAWVGQSAVAAVVGLPQLAIDPTQTTVSGLSSGGFMAVQLHVAYSSTFKKGAGVVAGGPLYCAEGSVVNATGRCMASPSGIPTSTLVTTTQNWATQGLIDPVVNLQQSKVYLFSGSLDSTVVPGVMNALQTYYNSFVPSANVVYKKNIAAEHAMVTDDYGSTCATKGTPFINDCNFDLAGDILQHLYGPLNARNNNALPTGNFIEFNQSAFTNGNTSLNSSAWAYVPQSCQAGSTTACRLHVVLHGCKQNLSAIGTQYVQKTGYNRWADTNNIVLLYPQTSSSATNGCWDWWGYNNANYAKKSGPQMVAIKAMIDHLSSGSTGGGGSGGGGTTPPATLPAPTQITASNPTSSSMLIGWGAVAGASAYHVYRGTTQVNSLGITGTTYTDSGLAASTAYTWTVKAVDANGVAGAASSPVTASTSAASSATCYTASNYAHTTAGRATQTLGTTYAKGSNQNMGLWNTFTVTTLKMTAANYYVIGTCN